MRFEIGNLQLFGFDIGVLFQRWLCGIRDIMPANLGLAFLRPAPRIEFRVTEQKFDVTKIDTTGRRSVIAALDKDTLDVAADRSLQTALIRNIKSPRMLQLHLLIPESFVMRRTLTLPYLARHNLRDVVAFQASRLTPFAVDKLFFAVQPLQENRVLETIEVEFVAALKTVVQPWIDQTERLTGFTVSCLNVQSENDDVPVCNLFGKPRVAGQWWRRLNHNGFLLIILILMLLSAAISPVYKARALMLERKDEIALLQSQSAGLLEVRNRLDYELLPLNDFIQYRKQYATSSEVVNELSRVVSKNIYITNFSLQNDSVTITGTGTSVVDLIEQINSSPLFFGAKFTSSLNRNARTEQDQFTAMFSLKNLSDGT